MLGARLNGEIPEEEVEENFVPFCLILSNFYYNNSIFMSNCY